MKEWPESGKDLNWKMKRIGVIQSFNTRQAAEDKGFDIAFEQLNIRKIVELKRRFSLVV
jgi:hypothetical protein